MTHLLPTKKMPDQENAQTDSFGDIRRCNHRPLIVQALSTDFSAAYVTHDDNFAAFLDSHVAVDMADSLTASGAVRSRTHKAIDHLSLAHRWDLAPDCTLQTVDRTTQRGVRTCLYPSLLQRFSTNDRMLRYSRLLHNIFTDTMFSNIKSYTGNKCAQLFATNFGWVRVTQWSRRMMRMRLSRWFSVVMACHRR